MISFQLNLHLTAILIALFLLSLCTLIDQKVLIVLGSPKGALCRLLCRLIGSVHRQTYYIDEKIGLSLLPSPPNQFELL